MTSEPTYREKGRAVVLAALMVLSVVAMSAAFAGGAAAATAQDDPEANGVSYDIQGGDAPGDLNPVWIGQEISITDTNLSSYAGFEVRAGGEPNDSTSSDVVATGSIENSENITFDTAGFEGGFYHINLIGGDGSSDLDGTVFRVASEELNTSFNSDAVPKGSQVNVTLETARENQWVNVSADGVSSDELNGLFDTDGAVSDVETYADEDVISLNVTGVNDETELEVNVSNASLDAGEYEFTFDVTDSSASDTATLQVTDNQLDYDFVEVGTAEEGGIAEITISTGTSSQAAIVLDSEDTTFASEMNVTGIEGDEVTLEYNTDNVSNAWSVAGDSDATVNQNVTSNILSNSPLPAYTWDLTLGNELGGDFNVSSEYDRGRLVISERGEIGDVSVATAPAADNVHNDYEAYNESTVTETNTIAQEDALIVTLEDFGAEGAVANHNNGLDEIEGITINATSQATGPIDESTTYNNTTLDAELINAGDLDTYNGDLIFTLNQEGAADLSSGTYNFALTINASESSYMDDDADNYVQEFEVEIVDRELSWDDIGSLPANEDATATGTTTVAPGTEFSAEADSPTSEGGFVQLSDAVVTAGEDGNHAFAAEFDLSEETPGVLFDLIASDTLAASNAEDAVLEDVELVAGDGEPVEEGLELSVSAPSEITTEESGSVDVELTNNDATEATATVTFEINGETSSQDVTVGANSTATASFDVSGSDLGAGDYDWSVNAGDAGSDSGTLTVSEPSSDGGSDGGADGGADGGSDGGSEDGGSDGGSEDGGSEDGGSSGTPGFGVGVALVALLGAAMLALRRQD